MIKSLQFMRGVMAIIIICYHSGLGGSDFICTITPCAVSFFFLLSGFLLMLRHPVTNLQQFNFKRFIISRLSKIYPLHALLTIIMVYSLGVTWVFAANMALIQSWFPQTDVHFSYNYVSWFVATMLFSYLVYPFLSLLINRIQLRWCWVITALLIVVGCANIFFTPRSMHNYLFYVFPPMRVIDFSAGLVTARLWLAAKNRWTKPSPVAAFIAVAMMVLMVVMANLPHNHDVVHAIYFGIVWIVPLSVMILALCHCELQGSPLTNAMSWKPMVWLGNISMELYLLQAIAGIVATKIAAMVPGGFLSGRTVHLLMVFAIVVPLAWATNKYFSTPLARKIKPHATNN